VGTRARRNSRISNLGGGVGTDQVTIVPRIESYISLIDAERFLSRVKKPVTPKAAQGPHVLSDIHKVVFVVCARRHKYVHAATA